MMVSAAADEQNESKPASFSYLHLWTGTLKETELEHVTVSNSETTGSISSPFVCQNAHTTVFTTVPGVCAVMNNWTADGPSLL